MGFALVLESEVDLFGMYDFGLFGLLVENGVIEWLALVGHLRPSWRYRHAGCMGQHCHYCRSHRGCHGDLPARSQHLRLGLHAHHRSCPQAQHQCQAR